MIIGHDPGHGYLHKGVPHPGTSLGTITERDWVMQQATELTTALPWAQHYLLRHGESGPVYPMRAASAAELGCDIVFCHHVNAGPTPELDGLMVFVIPGDHITREVGDAIMRAAPSELRRRKPRSTPATSSDWTRDAHGVLRHYHERGVRAVLIEWGFATSPLDRAVLLSAASLPARCMAAGAGSARAFELLHVGPA